jgi:DNA polymerase-4
VKYSDFRQITRNQSFSFPIGDYDTIVNTAKQLLAATEPEGQKIRLLGITLSNFQDNTLSEGDKANQVIQLSLFD